MAAPGADAPHAAAMAAASSARYGSADRLTSLIERIRRSM